MRKTFANPGDVISLSQKSVFPDMKITDFSRNASGILNWSMGGDSPGKASGEVIIIAIENDATWPAILVISDDLFGWIALIIEQSAVHK